MRGNRIMTASATLGLVALLALGWSACSNPAEPEVERELVSARAATDDFMSLDAGLAAGYVDIGVVMQSMGHHYLREGLLDGSFEIDQPEILVYAPDDRGAMRLV